MSLYDFFTNITTGRFALLALGVFLVSTVVLDRLNPEKTIRANPNVGDKYLSIGMTFGYKAEDLYTMLDGFSEQNTKDERVYLILDLVYPLLYGLSWAIILAYLQRIYMPTSTIRNHYLWVLPLCAMVFDWAENLSMIWIQANYRKGEISNTMRWMTDFSRAMTMLKITFIAASFFVAFALLLGIAASWWKGPRTRPQGAT